MKSKKVFLMGLFCVVVLCLLGYQGQLAAARKERPVRLAVVNLRELLQNWKKYTDYKAKADSEEEKIFSELKKLSNEVETAQVVLSTRKVGTGDYWDLRQELVVKQGSLEVKREFYKQQLEQMVLRNQQWTEKIYKEIVSCVAKIAEQKDIDIVLEKDELGLPVLLYSAEDLDITKDVMALLDANSD